LQRLDAPDVDAHRAVELQGAAARRDLRVAEDDADLLAQLVDKNHRGFRLGDATRELAQGLRHETSLQARQRITHLAFYFSAWHEGGDAIDHDDINSVGAHECLTDLQRLLARIRLRDQEVVNFHTEGPGISGVQRVLDVDVAGRAAQLLRFRDDVLAQGRLTGRLRSED